MTNCPICSNQRHTYFQAKILQKYKVNYFLCSKCGLLQTEEPYWLEEAYSSAIADSDVGLVSRNIDTSKKIACILYFLFTKNGKYHDIAGGYGMFTRLMRDIGFDFYWSDLYCENIFAKGFEAAYLPQKHLVAITAFEVLEHVYDPVKFIRDSLTQSATSSLIFSTQLFEGNPPQPDSWWYYSLSTGQHISFYQKKTLNYLGDKLSLKLYVYKNLHILTDKTVNPTFFMVLNRLLNSRLSDFIYKYVQINMKSKTSLDYQQLIQSKL